MRQQRSSRLFARPRMLALPTRSQHGFTLIELGIVLLIIMLVATLVIPNLGDRSRAELLSHARRLSLVARHLRDRAMLNGRTYRLYYDMESHRYWAEWADQDDEHQTFQREDDRLGRGIELPEPIGFTDVVAPFLGGKLREGVAFTEFYPDGFVERTVIHIDNGEEAYTILLESLTGSVHLLRGYKDFDFDDA